MNLCPFSLAGTQKYLGRPSRAFLKLLGLGRRARAVRPLHFGTREKLDEILKKGEEGGRIDRRRGRGRGGGGAELAPSKEMDPFIMCTEVGEREGGRSGGGAARPLVARSVR